MKSKITAAAVAFIAMLFISADNKPETEKLVNPGFRINSEGNDFSPSITADGSIMVFDSKKPEEKSHNIFICYKKNRLWGEAFPLFNKNSGFNDETPFISADGRTILFASDRPGGITPPLTADGRKRITFDIYISRYAGGMWSEPELLGGEVNTFMNERSPSLSRDGKFLFFTRWPFNNIGKSKIYRAGLSNGKYSGITELPESINSGSAEVGFIPSYRVEGRYYFSSMRSGGFGGWDIYYTTSSGRGFSRPVNAGKGINGEYNEFSLSESATGKAICSDRFGGLGGYDIYVDSSSVKPGGDISLVKTSYSKKTQLRITASDSLTGKPLPGMSFRIKLITGEGKTERAGRTSEVKSGPSGYFDIYPKDDVSSLVIEPLSADYAGGSIRIKVLRGQYQDMAICLKKKEECAERASAPDKIDDKKTVTPSGREQYTKAEFRSIYFDFGSSSIKTEHVPELYSIVEYMRRNSSARLYITGYADSVGRKKINRRLSSARALRVKKYITGMSIDPGRIITRGAGESGCTGKNRRFRRVDFHVSE